MKDAIPHHAFQVQSKRAVAVAGRTKIELIDGVGLFVLGIGDNVRVRDHVGL